MRRAITFAVLALSGAAVGCDDGKARAKRVVDRVDQVIDDLDIDEAKQQLTRAKDAVASGLDAAVECSWAARIADDVARDAIAAPVKELKRLCSFDAPLARATRAVVIAENAKAEQPAAPSLTECSSDDWATMRPRLDASPHASDPRWVAVKTRWAKVCP